MRLLTKSNINLKLKNFMQRETTENLEQAYTHAKNAKNSLDGAAKSAMSEFANADVKGMASQLVGELSNFFQAKKGDVVGVKNKCEEKIKDNPFTVVCATLAVGAIIGMLCSRK